MEGDYDIAVVGGGINGAGIARDAALRGMRVILLEKSDFGSGTSSWSSRLIHGGLRYLEYGEIPLVFESLHERRRLRRLAPHLVTPLRLTIPIYRDSRRGRFMISLGLTAYDLLSLGKNLPRHRMLKRAELIREVPGLRQDGLVGGAEYHDAQVAFAERLVVENIIAAREAGADTRNYSPVMRIDVRRGAAHSLHFIDRASGNEQEVSARIVINAAGPWVDRVLRTTNRDVQALMGGTKGSHIVVGLFATAPSSAFYVEAKSDGRPFFIIPWNGQFLIGTTDIRYDGEPGDVRASIEEIDYLLQETNRVFPAARLTVDDLHFAYAGVRPLPKVEKGPESAITRKHIIYQHRDEANGLISVIGGKLTTYRSLAEQVVDQCERLSGKKAGKCRTRNAPLPGGADVQMAKQVLQKTASLTAACIERLLSIYGSRAPDVVRLATAGGPAGFIDDEASVLAAEVAHAIREEAAITLTDIVHRRIMTGLSADQGTATSQEVARVAALELGWSQGEIARQMAALHQYNARLRPAGHVRTDR